MGIMEICTLAKHTTENTGKDSVQHMVNNVSDVETTTISVGCKVKTIQRISNKHVSYEKGDSSDKFYANSLNVKSIKYVILFLLCKSG